MPQPRVLNKKRDPILCDAIYVGRPTKWGNPFSHLPGTLAKHHVATRDEAVAAYRAYILTSPLLADLHELAGHDLVGWCVPQACQAQVLVELANRPAGSA
jgi:hypothetical protein